MGLGSQVVQVDAMRAVLLAAVAGAAGLAEEVPAQAPLAEARMPAGNFRFPVGLTHLETVGLRLLLSLEPNGAGYAARGMLSCSLTGRDSPLDVSLATLASPPPDSTIEQFAGQLALLHGQGLSVFKVPEGYVITAPGSTEQGGLLAAAHVRNADGVQLEMFDPHADGILRDLVWSRMSFEQLQRLPVWCVQIESPDSPADVTVKIRSPEPNRRLEPQFAGARPHETTVVVPGAANFHPTLITTLAQEGIAAVRSPTNPHGVIVFAPQGTIGVRVDGEPAASVSVGSLEAYPQLLFARNHRVALSAAVNEGGENRQGRVVFSLDQGRTVSSGTRDQARGGQLLGVTYIVEPDVAVQLAVSADEQGAIEGPVHMDLRPLVVWMTILGSEGQGPSGVSLRIDGDGKNLLQVNQQSQQPLSPLAIAQSLLAHAARCNVPARIVPAPDSARGDLTIEFFVPARCAASATVEFMGGARGEMYVGERFEGQVRQR